MRRPRTAPLITPFTCREREGERLASYTLTNFASYTSDSVSYFLPLSSVVCLSVEYHGAGQGQQDSIYTTHT